ncbi:MAG: restriction endonuclease subunit S [Bacteroidales bacterium]|nr:restriction endonuclease subunit S [Bacteroidales bacterium]
MTKQPTHAPSGYKPSSLGPIPEDWEVKRLGEVCTFFDSQRVPIKDAERVKMKGEFPYYGASGIIDYVNDYLFDDDLILLGEDGANIINRSTPLAFLVSGKVWVNNHAHVLKSKDQYNRYFICQYLESLTYDKYNTGTAQPKLNREICENIPVLIPFKDEQDKIAALLSLWDTAIEKQISLIEKLTLRKRGLMQQLLTGEKRLKGFEGGSFHRLGNYISECNRRNNGCNRVLSVTNTRGFILQEEQFDKIVASKNTSNYKVVRQGEFAYNPSRVNVGSLAMLNEYDEGILSPMYIVFKANDNIEKNYLLQCLQSYWFRGHIPAYTQGSVRDSLSFDGLCSMKFYIPTLQEQKAISAILELADKEIKIQKQKLATMQEEKRGLMQVLLTGKRRVKIN